MYKFMCVREQRGEGVLALLDLPLMPWNNWINEF